MIGKTLVHFYSGGLTLEYYNNEKREKFIIAFEKN